MNAGLTVYGNHFYVFGLFEGHHFPPSSSKDRFEILDKSLSESYPLEQDNQLFTAAALSLHGALEGAMLTSCRLND